MLFSGLPQRTDLEELTLQKGPRDFTMNGDLEGKDLLIQAYLYTFLGIFDLLEPLCGPKADNRFI